MVQRDPRVQVLPRRLRDLRTPGLKRYREGWEAALFCQGMSVVLGTTVYFALEEDEDHDFVTLWRRGDEHVHTPVQLKELPAEKLNPHVGVNELLEDLRRYEPAPRLVVAVRINRDGRLPEIQCPDLDLGGIFLFGCCSPDGREWYVLGDLLGEPKEYYFHFPV
ncbi:MAG: hypothetical protein H6825_05470 [Planctomycetes bacterium]|nr:hypothetical protein [Planctomycetota bacterium]